MPGRAQALSLTRSRDGSLNQALGLAASVAASVAAGVGVGVVATGPDTTEGGGASTGASAAPGITAVPSGGAAAATAAPGLADDVDEGGSPRNHVLKGSVFIEFGSDEDALRAVRVLDGLSLLPIGGPMLRARHFRQYATLADDGLSEDGVETLGGFEIVPDRSVRTLTRDEGKEQSGKESEVGTRISNIWCNSNFKFTLRRIPEIHFVLPIKCLLKIALTEFKV